MARSREFKLFMKFVYWFCILGIVLFLSYLGYEVYKIIVNGLNEG